MRLGTNDHKAFLRTMRERWDGVRVQYEHPGYDYDKPRSRHEAKPTKEEREHSEKPRTVLGTIRFDDSDWCKLVEDDGYEWDIDQDLLGAQAVPVEGEIAILQLKQDLRGKRTYR